MQDKLLVTGGAGFIGSNFTLTSLAETGAEQIRARSVEPAERVRDAQGKLLCDAEVFP